MLVAAARGMVATFLVAMIAFFLQLQRDTFGEWTSFFAALPIFGGALAQSGASYFEHGSDDRNMLAFGAFLALVPFAALGGVDVGGGGIRAMVFVGGAVIVMSTFGLLGGALSRLSARFSFAVGSGMTAIALLFAVVAPSIPITRNPLVRRPDASYVKNLPVAGELRTDGAAIAVHGYRYRARARG